MDAETTLAVAAGLIVSAIALLVFAKAEKLLPALAGPAVPPTKARKRWAAAGVLLLLLTVPITVAVWNVVPPGPWPTWAFAVPALPLVVPAWQCFKRAGWTSASEGSRKGMSAWKLGCFLAAAVMVLLLIGGIAADSLGLLK